MNYDIKTRRLELGLTLDELSKKIGVSSATISRWERGNIKSLLSKNILPLAKALNISAFELISDDKETR